MNTPQPSCPDPRPQVVTLTATVADLTAGDAADTRLDAVLGAAVCAAAAGISGAPACTATVTSSEVFATGSEPSTGLQGTQVGMCVCARAHVCLVCMTVLCAVLLMRCCTESVSGVGCAEGAQCSSPLTIPLPPLLGLRAHSLC
jgi:hypothetical protein